MTKPVWRTEHFPAWRKKLLLDQKQASGALPQLSMLWSVAV
jgi:hypothetical protein